MKKESIKIFEEKKVRTIWNEEQEKWYISIVDVVEILADSYNGLKNQDRISSRFISKKVKI